MNFRLLLVAIAFISFPLFAKSNESTEFIIDKQAVNQEFDQLNQLEQLVIDNNICSISELSKRNINVSSYSFLKLNALSPMEPPLGIPSFFWGCCLGPIGIALAYIFSDNDKSEAKKALTGCAVSTGVSVIFYFVYILIIASVYSSGY